MHRILRGSLIGVALMLLSFVGIYLYAIRSEPYRFSEHWVRQSVEVRDRIGSVTSTRLSLTEDFSDEFHGDVRNAEISTYVQGERGSLTARLSLEKTNADWKVLRYRIDPE